MLVLYNMYFSVDHYTLYFMVVFNGKSPRNMASSVYFLCMYGIRNLVVIGAYTTVMTPCANRRAHDGMI